MNDDALNVLRADLAKISRKLDAHDAYAREPVEARLLEAMKSDWWKQSVEKLDHYLRSLDVRRPSLLDRFSAEVPPAAVLALIGGVNDAPEDVQAALLPLFEAIIDGMPHASRETLLQIMQSELGVKP